MGTDAQRSAVRRAQRAPRRPSGVFTTRNEERMRNEEQAMRDIAALCRGDKPPRSCFDGVVLALARVLPVEVVVIVSSDPSATPLYGVVGAGGPMLGRAVGVAVDTMRYLGGKGAALGGLAAVQGRGARWIALPIAGRRRAPAGILAVAVAHPVDERSLVFVAGVARAVAPLLERHTRWAHGRKAEAVCLAEALSVLSSSVGDRPVLDELAPALGGYARGACVIDTVDPAGRSTYAPGVRDSVVSRALAPVVAGVLANGTPAVAARRDAPRNDADRACEALGADWLLSAPLRAGGEPLGTITMFGRDGRRVRRAFIAEVATHIGVAIENARIYRRALRGAAARDEVLGSVAHDLKNPLGTIIMNAQLLLSGAPAVERRARVRKHLESILRSSQRMLTLIKDLLDVAALTEGSLAMHPSQVSPRHLVAVTFEALALQAEKGSVRLVNDVPRSLPLVRADPDRIVQVLMNLVGNAIKFTPPGGSVRAHAAPVGHEVALSVTDTGAGMTPEQVARMFDRFWTGADSTRTGSGLGLAISKSIVELSGGRVWAESQVGVGTTVAFTLPSGT